MTPQAALKKLKRKHKTLKAVKELLGKNRVETSVPTLSRILNNPDYEPGHKVWSTLLELAE